MAMQQMLLGIPSASGDNGGSMYFAGSGGNDYIQVSNSSSVYQLAGGDFTLECWVYLSTTSGIQRIISADEGSQGTEYTAIRSNPNHGWQAVSYTHLTLPTKA